MHRNEFKKSNSLNCLLDIYAPGEEVLLGSNTKAFAKDMDTNDGKYKLNVKEMREEVSEALKFGSVPYPEAFSETSYESLMVGPLECCVLKAARAKSVPTLVMFYGGGFCLNTLAAHKSFMANVASKVSCNIILPVTPLAPENKASEIVAASDQFMFALAEDPQAYGVSNNLILLGWSSGGNLALTVALNLQKKSPTRFEKFSQIILMSSWIDLTMYVHRQCPFQKQQAGDTIAAGDRVLTEMSMCYLDVGDKGNEVNYSPASRSENDLAGLPLTTLIVGGSEVLLGDSVYMAHVLNEAGTTAQLIVLEGQTHNYLVFDKLSQDGVFVPDLLVNLIDSKEVQHLIGDDGLGVDVIRFNMSKVASSKDC
jgi:epsilon-lactone hydrolase